MTTARRGTRFAQAALARAPRLYLSLLRAVGRGGTQKRTLLALLRDGDVAIDIGANEGYFTLLMSDVVGRTGRVHAFEPIQPTFDRLSVRVADTAWFRNIALVRAACADTAGAATMFVPGADSGQASLVRHEAAAWACADAVDAQPVDTIRFDDYAAANGLTRIDFIKLDVEGAELAALTGMGATLAACRPLLCLELYREWTRGFGHEPRDVIGWLRRAGYDRWFVLRDDAEPADEDDVRRLADEGSLDVICARSDAHAGRIARLGR